jgi:hypothetical protein
VFFFPLHVSIWMFNAQRLEESRLLRWALRRLVEELKE